MGARELRPVMKEVGTIELSSWEIGALLIFVAFVGHGLTTLTLRRRGKGPSWPQFLAVWSIIVAVVIASTTLSTIQLVLVLVGFAIVASGLRWHARRRHR